MYLYYAIPGPYGSTYLYKAVNNATNAPEAFSGGTTWIGGDNGNKSLTFDGYMDEVAVFTNSLCETNIQNLFLRSLGLTTGVAPNILTQPPSSISIYTGQPLLLSVLDGGIPTPTNAWRCSVDGTTWMIITNGNASGTNSPNLVVNNFPPNKWPAGATNFEVIVGNGVGNNVTSTKTIVKIIPIPQWNSGIWTANFDVITADDGGPDVPYVGRGVLGTGTYWNALSGGLVANIPPSLMDDGATHCPVNLSTTNNNGNWASGAQYNSILLDQYMNFGTNGTSLVFTNVPKGRYNLALYGIDGSYANRGTIFTVKGVSQSVTNVQDVFLLPDNTVIYTNLLVTNGTLEVHMQPHNSPLNTPNTEGDFNGAQLEMIAGPVHSVPDQQWHEFSRDLWGWAAFGSYQYIGAVDNEHDGHKSVYDQSHGRDEILSGIYQ